MWRRGEDGVPMADLIPMDGLLPLVLPGALPQSVGRDPLQAGEAP
jgi:hypothetical protein